MLQSLHVKNLALMEEAEINFASGLNILSGETGAGKSILLGALHLALGGKVSKELLRDSAREALVEAVFYVTEERQRLLLKEMGVEVYDDQVILTRRITDTRSVARINGETVPAAKLAEAGAVFLDIYGQNEHQSLSRKSRHMELLDDYAKQQLSLLKEKLKEDYTRYSALEREWKEASLDEGQRAREISFLEHEVSEIADAALAAGEDETLETEYRRASNGRKITEAVQSAYADTSAADGAADRLGRAIRRLHTVEDLDGRLSELLRQLTEIDGLLNDCNREISSYMEESEFDALALEEMQTRLNLINHLKMKYGNSVEEILRQKQEKEQRVEQLRSYDEYLEQLEKNRAHAGELVEQDCTRVSEVRQEQAQQLAAEVRRALGDLNFLDVAFCMDFGRLDHVTPDGFDDVQFMISTNPGEPLKPLQAVASGGEMSRIMLAMKTVLAENEGVDTLIFDEIDSGISGRTAQAVSEKLSVLARDHQVICITHLPQIAAMADHHFLIAKEVEGTSTISRIYPLDAEKSVEELARMLGGTAITQTVLDNAREMKALADVAKK